MSDTPRTDEAEAKCATSGYVYADFARTLERELAACRLALADELVAFARERRTNGASYNPNVFKDAARLRDTSQPTPEDLA